jgi:hypothetical protein
MDLYQERITATVQRVFGSGASVGGSMGSGKFPGVLTVLLDGKPLGSGRTLEAALQRATAAASGLAGRIKYLPSIDGRYPSKS